MKAASWILLVLVALMIVLGSVASLSVAYIGGPDADPFVAELTQGNPQALSALRGRRGTAAAFSLAFAALFIAVVMGPYRRGEVWAWWALLCSTSLFSLAVLLRIPLIHSQSGSLVGALVLAVVVVALLLDVGRLWQRRL